MTVGDTMSEVVTGPQEVHACVPEHFLLYRDIVCLVLFLRGLHMIKDHFYWAKPERLYRWRQWQTPPVTGPEDLKWWSVLVACISGRHGSWTFILLVIFLRCHFCCGLNSNCARLTARGLPCLPGRLWQGRCEGLLCSLPEGASFLAWTSSLPLPSMNPQKGPEGTGRVRKQVGLTTRRWDDGVELSRFPFLVGRGRDWL